MAKRRKKHQKQDEKIQQPKRSFIHTLFGYAAIAIAIFTVVVILFPPNPQEPSLTEEQKRIRAEKINKRIYHAISAGPSASAYELQEIKLYLNDWDPNVRLHALQAIYKLGGEREIGIVIGKLADQDINVRIQAVQILSETENASLLEHLKYALKMDSSERVRLFALQGLSKYRTSDMVGLLIEALVDNSYVVRKTAHDYLKEFTQKDYGYSDEYLDKSYWQVKGTWTSWWQEQRGKSLGEVLVGYTPPEKSIVERKQEELRNAISLTKEKRAQSRARLEELLKWHPDPAFRTLLLEAIWESKDKEMVEVLKRVYSSEKEWVVKLKIKEAIGRLESVN